MKVIENWFRASDGKDIFYNEFLPDNIDDVKFVVQIFHGMAEHSERYTHFAEFLTSKGAAVYASDHRGHGRNCLRPGEYGVWAKKGAWFTIVDDLKVLNDITAKNFPDKPNFILGHSMGSFLARSFITKYSRGLNGVILSGTGTNSNLILKSDLTARICFSDAEFSLIIYMMHIMSVKYFFGGWLDDWNLPF